MFKKSLMCVGPSMTESQETQMKAEIENSQSDFRKALIERLRTTHAVASSSERKRIDGMIQWLKNTHDAIRTNTDSLSNDLNEAGMGNTDILPGFDEDACDFLTIELQEVEGVDNCLVMKLKGQLDVYSIQYFQRSARRVIEAGFVNLIFLLDRVDYVSSIGVGAFVQLQKATREKGGSLVIADAHPKVMQIFKLMCLDKLLACSDSLDDAAAFLRGQAPVFPKTIGCPICDRKLRVVKSGRFRCPGCKTVVSIGKSGAVSLS
jgi:anti-sigma B factor antagonist